MSDVAEKIPEIVGPIGLTMLVQECHFCGKMLEGGYISTTSDRFKGWLSCDDCRGKMAENRVLYFENDISTLSNVHYLPSEYISTVKENMNKMFMMKIFQELGNPLMDNLFDIIFDYIKITMKSLMLKIPRSKGSFSLGSLQEFDSNILSQIHKEEKQLIVPVCFNDDGRDFEKGITLADLVKANPILKDFKDAFRFSSISEKYEVFIEKYVEEEFSKI